MRFIVPILYFLLVSLSVHSQYCTSDSLIYGLTNTGSVYPINTVDASVNPPINVVGSSTPSSSNGLAYNPFYNSFFYFKRNPDASGQQFVTFDQINNTPRVLAPCPTTTRIVTGCCNLTGDGYYCMDVLGRLYYYNISLNSWTKITNSFITSNGTNVSNLFSTLGSGDIAMDVFGNLWIISSGAAEYCLYKTKSLLPVVPVLSIEVVEIAPLRPTPTGFVFAGICFNKFGQIYLSTAPPDDKLFILNNDLTISFIKKFSISGVGNDMTSCYFPSSVLNYVEDKFIRKISDKNISFDLFIIQSNLYCLNISNPGNYRNIYVFNIKGELLKEITNIKKINLIDMSNYPSDIYIINVDGIKSFKIIK